MPEKNHVLAAYPGDILWLAKNQQFAGCRFLEVFS
jgi:hypothetical protein